MLLFGDRFFFPVQKSPQLLEPLRCCVIDAIRSCHPCHSLDGNDQDTGVRNLKRNGSGDTSEAGEDVDTMEGVDMIEKVGAVEMGIAEGKEEIERLVARKLNVGELTDDIVHKWTVAVMCHAGLAREFTIVLSARCTLLVTSFGGCP